MKNSEEKEPLADFSTESASEQAPLHQEAELPDASVEVTDPVAKAEAELTAYQDKYVRLYSEFENYKKRVSRDRLEQSKMAAADILLSILPVIDDFERALKSAGDTKENEALKSGIQLIYNKFRTSLESKGLKPMNAAGTLFDPELHDAIVKVPAPDESLKGKVVEEVEKGYFLNDRVLRHAKVVVGE